MTAGRLASLWTLGALLVTPAARGQTPVTPVPPAAEEDGAEEDAEEAAPEEDETDLADRQTALEEEVRQLRGVVAGRTPGYTLSAYADLGFYVPEGNGAGVIQDVGPASSRYFPQYADRYGWVFLGDILAPAINTRGDVADLGNLPGVNRLDAIDSNGAPGFIVNEVNLTLRSALAANVLGTVSLDFLPRAGVDFHLGDVFAVDIASLEWLLGRERRTSIFVGKFDSVIGIEYPERKSNQRFGITPSLIARYTTGTPIGIKLRTKLGPRDLIMFAAALTNGSSGIETFHFFDETDSNAGKTASGRLQLSLPLPFQLDLGVSGEYGAQDHALDSRHPAWFVGADLQLGFRRFQLKGEWLRGASDGETGTIPEGTKRVYGLRLHNGGYVAATVLLTSRFGLLLRGGLRDALVWLGDPSLPEGAERLYVTKSWRLTVGMRAVITERIVAKAEYLHNGEYGGVPQIRNDVFTTSLVLSY